MRGRPVRAAEPAGSAALTGVMADRSAGRAPEGTVLALVTASGVKAQRWLPTGGGRALEVPADLDAIGMAAKEGHRAR